MSDKRLHPILGGFAAALLVAGSSYAASVTCVGAGDDVALSACANAGDGFCQVDGVCVITNGLVLTVPVHLYSESGASITRAAGSTIWIDAGASGSEISGLTIVCGGGGAGIRQNVTAGWADDVVIRNNVISGPRGLQQFADIPKPSPDGNNVPNRWVIEGNTISHIDGGDFAILLGGSDNVVTDNVLSGSRTGFNLQAQLPGGGSGNHVTHNTSRVVQTPATIGSYPRPIVSAAFGAGIGTTGGNNFAHNCVEAIHFGLAGAQSGIMLQDQNGLGNMWQHNDGTGSSQFGTNGSIGVVATAGTANSVFMHNDFEGANPGLYASGAASQDNLYIFNKIGPITTNSWWILPNLPWIAVSFGTLSPNVFADLQACDGDFGQGAGGTATFLTDRWRADLRCQQDPDHQPTRDCQAKSASGVYTPWSSEGDVLSSSLVEGLAQRVPDSELHVDAFAADIAGDAPHPATPRTVGGLRPADPAQSGPRPGLFR